MEYALNNMCGKEFMDIKIVKLNCYELSNETEYVQVLVEDDGHCTADWFDSTIADEQNAHIRSVVYDSLEDAFNDILETEMEKD
jgi:hypothetical protein